MAKRTLRAVLCITVEDMSDEERASDLEGMGGEAEYGKLPDLTEYLAEEAEKGWSEGSPVSLASVLANFVTEHTSPDMFAGTDKFVQFTEAGVTSAEWADEAKGDRPADRKEG